jgi:xanthine dehydrogenase accessory factor
MVCGGRASLFYECYGTGESLVLFGAGHIGRALARLLPGLGYRLTVIDSREEYVQGFAEAVGQAGARFPHACVCHAYDTSFADLKLPQNSWVVIATHSHAFDYQVLEQCLKDCVFKDGVQAQYIGVVASRKKRDKFFAQLKEAVPNADTSMIYMPAGLDIGGTGPEEIALSLMSELQALRFGRAGHRHMRGARTEQQE